MNIPFYKPSITQAEIDEVVDTLKSGWLTTGPKTRRFEQEFAAYVEQKHAVAMNSCTAALHLALEAVGLEAGNTAVVPSMTFAATAEVVRYFDARPLLVDCRADDFNLDVADAGRRIEAALARGERVKAILPVHYGGQVADMAGVQTLAKRFGLRVIEDAAHCCPAHFRDGADAPWRPVGAGSDVTCFSFYANKCITTGEGGMACTPHEDLAERMRTMCLHGISKDAWKRFRAEGSWYYEIVAPGFKYNLTDVASAIGLHQLRRSDEMHRQRTARAELYTRLLGDVDELILPTVHTDRVHSWHLYVVRLKLDELQIDRAEVIAELKRAGITTSVHWMPLHLHPYYRQKYQYQPDDFPVASSLYPEIITLPLFPDMTEEQVTHVAETLRSILARNLKSSVAAKVFFASEPVPV
jgi:dTDP-4-amino-4,6-dideoxygalactose transaminase